MSELLKSLAERLSDRRVLERGSRLPRVLLGLLLTVAVAGCGGPAGAGKLALPSGSSGSQYLPGPVSDIELQTLVPPGSVELTTGPVHGVGPARPAPVPVARVRGHRGVLHVLFLCEDAVRQVRARYTWYDSYSDLPCDPGPNTISLAVGWCSGHKPCQGRNAFTFDMPEAGAALPPGFTVPAGASWAMLAWIDPPAALPGAGVSAAGAGLARFTGYGLDFSYPRRWGSLVPAQVPGDDPGGVLVFEGSARMHDPCPLTKDRSGVTTAGPCGRAPVRALAPGGVLVAWSTTNLDGVAGGHTLGRPVMIGGRQGRLFSGPASAVGLAVAAGPGAPAGGLGGPSCRDLGATWVVVATVSLGLDKADQMLACLRGPGTSTAITEVMAMLRSLRFGR